MKFSLMVLFCSIFILENKYASGNSIVFGLFQKVHDTAHKVREDIGEVWHKKSDKQVKKAEVPNGGQSVDVPVNQNVNNNPAPVPTPESAPAATESRVVFPGEAVVQTTTVKPDAIPTDDKEGKESFKGACIPGYYKTPDGRCKPSF